MVGEAAGALPGHDVEGREPAPDGVAQWEDLPASAQSAAIAVAAEVLGAVPAERLPGLVAPIARFTPRKRASRGKGPLGRALATDAGFRAMVGQYLPAGFGVADGRIGHASAAAARAFLLRIPDSGEVIAAAARADELAELRGQVVELQGVIESLTARLVASATWGEAHRVDSEQPIGAAGSGGAAGSKGAAAVDDSEARLAKLKGRLRNQGIRVKEAESQAERATQELQRIRGDVDSQVAHERKEADKWRAVADRERGQAEAAQQALDRVRSEAGQTKADTDRRISLLLDTVRRAATGLEREWRLATGGAAPADVVARDLPDVGSGPRRTVDGSLLLDWLGLPDAHLIIDGYNVTKTGYGQLTLAQQRDRLLRSLRPIAARTGAEITVVFDGADVIVPSASTRSVRVMFSPPGVIADDVIRRVAAAEPEGRVVVVVTSDREIVEGVRRTGARTAPSAVLLEVI